MAWVYLAVARLLEIGWPLGLKIAETHESRIRGVITAVLLWPPAEPYCGWRNGTSQWARHTPSGPALALSGH